MGGNERGLRKVGFWEHGAEESLSWFGRCWRRCSFTSRMRRDRLRCLWVVVHEVDGHGACVSVAWVGGCEDGKVGWKVNEKREAR
jgi:hypothetical protein